MPDGGYHNGGPRQPPRFAAKNMKLGNNPNAASTAQAYQQKMTAKRSRVLGTKNGQPLSVDKANKAARIQTRMNNRLNKAGWS